MWRKRTSSQWKFCKTFSKPCVQWHKRRKTWKSFKGNPLNGLEANKVNSEIWQQTAHQTKSFDLKLQNVQKLILKSLSVLSKKASTLYEHRWEKDRTKLVALVKATIKNCADTAVFLGKANDDILTYQREKIKPELNQNYRHISIKKVSTQDFFSVMISQKFSKTWQWQTK